MDPPKSAIVTGAASGLGRAIAVELARHGWRVALADINPAGSTETAALIAKAGGQSRVEPLDVTEPESWRNLRARLEADWPQLDLLVNNAGVGMGGGFDQWSLDDWRWIVNINLYGAIYGCHTMIDWLKRNPAGSHIVNIASLAAIASPPGMAPYNTTKAALVGFSETLYTELRPHRVSVSVVCPAFVPTGILDNGRFPTPEHRRLADTMMHTSRCTADDVARAVRRAIERKKFYVFVPRAAGIIWRLKRLMPLRLLNMVARERDKAAGRLERKE